MFTVKLMRGENNSEILLKQSAEVVVKRMTDGSAAVVTRASADDDTMWNYVGGDDPSNYAMAVIENAAGKTTEVVRP